MLGRHCYFLNLVFFFFFSSDDSASMRARTNIDMDVASRYPVSFRDHVSRKIPFRTIPLPRANYKYNVMFSSPVFGVYAPRASGWCEVVVAVFESKSVLKPALLVVVDYMQFLFF